MDVNVSTTKQSTKNVVTFGEVDYDLTESLLSLDNGCVELILLGPGFNEKYRIDTVG